MSTADWYFVLNGQPTGPVSAAEVAAKIAAGDLSSRCLVWREGLGNWEKAALHFGPDAQQAPPAVENSSFRRPSDRNRNSPIGPDGLYVGAPSRSFFGAAGACLRRYFKFSGRASRSEYWKFTLFCTCLGFLAGLFDGMQAVARGGQPQVAPLSVILTVLLLFPSLAVSWRRLHDVNRSGWWLIGIYPVILVCIGIVAGSMSLFGAQVAMGVGVLAAVVVLMYLLRIFLFLTAAGDRGPNRFG